MPTIAINLTSDQQKALDAINSERNVYNNPASGTLDLNEIQKFIDEAGKLL